MKPRVLFLLANSLLFSFSACSLLVGSAEQSVYQLNTHPDFSALGDSSAKDSAALSCAGTLSVRDSRAPLVYLSKKIVFSKDELELGNYQFASWSEPPAQRFPLELLKALENRKKFSAVTHLSAGVLSDLELNSEIQEFYHDISTTPGAVRLAIKLELIEVKTRRIKAQRVFRVVLPVTTFDSAGAVKAFVEASNKLILEMLPWLEESACNG